MPSPRTAFHQRRVLRWPKGVTYLQTVSTANLERSDSIDTQLPTNSILHACRELLQLRAILVSIHYEALADITPNVLVHGSSAIKRHDGVDAFLT